MTIEFSCAHCDKPMRAPDGSSGRQGKCAQCGNVMVIPSASAPLRRSPIEFDCQACGKLVATPASAAGKKGKCPHCGSVVQIPTLPVSAAKSEPRVSNSTPTPTAAGSIEFHCPACEHFVRTSAAAVGKKGKCPACGEVFVVPAASEPTQANPTTNSAPNQQAIGAQPGLARPSSSRPAPSAVPPKAATASPLTPLGNSQLTPLGGSPLTPLGGSPLIPLGNAPATSYGNSPLTPLTDAGFGAFPSNNSLSPLSAPLDPLMSQPLGNPFGDLSNPLGDMNPYAYAPLPTQSQSTVSPFRKKKVVRDDIERNGLPWERGNQDGVFLRTVNLIIFSPNVAFCKLKVDGGVGKAVGFSSLGALIAAGSLVLYAALAFGVFILYGLTTFGGTSEQIASVLRPAFFVGLALFLGIFIRLIVHSTIGILIVSIVMHLSLLLTIAANKNFETTLRTCLYCNGAFTAIIAVPFVGWIYLWAFPIYVFLGLANAHETSKLRAFIGCCIGFSVLFALFLGLAAIAKP